MYVYLVGEHDGNEAEREAANSGTDGKAHVVWGWRHLDCHHWPPNLVGKGLI